MAASTARSIADSLETIESDRPIELIWHGGEPTAGGVMHLRRLLDAFEPLRQRGRIRHALQTNGIVVNDRWCEMFKTYDINVGVSIDGPAEMNYRRRDLRGKDTFERAVRGIRTLREHDIPFSIIAVIDRAHLPSGSRVFEFLSSLGPRSVGFNIEETEGPNVSSPSPLEDLVHFWEEVFDAWEETRSTEVREIARLLDAIQQRSSVWDHLDGFPTILWNGDVVLLSPELAGTRDAVYADFVVGNVNYALLPEILQSARESAYVADFVEGVDLCRRTCNLFNLCGGGQAANKYFERGTLKTTETEYCRGAKISVTMALANVARRAE